MAATRRRYFGDRGNPFTRPSQETRRCERGLNGGNARREDQANQSNRKPHHPGGLARLTAAGHGCAECYVFHFELVVRRSQRYDRFPMNGFAVAMGCPNGQIERPAPLPAAPAIENTCRAPPWANRIPLA